MLIQELNIGLTKDGFSTCNFKKKGLEHAALEQCKEQWKLEKRRNN